MPGMPECPSSSAPAVLPNGDPERACAARTVAGYRPPPPKKPLASRKICERMNGSGSAPITIDPGWPQPFQQTTYESGVFRGQTVTPPDDHWPL